VIVTIFPIPRRLAVVPAALALAVTALAPPAAAGPLVRIQNTVDDFSCVFDTQEGATVFFFGSSSDAGSGSAAFVEGEDLYLEGWEGTAVFGTNTLSASVGLATVPEGEPVGTVSVSATTTLGGPTVEQVNDRSGNTWTRGTITTADYTYSDVVITIDGFTPILDDTTCTGQRTIFDVRSTDPASRIYRDSTLTSDPCPILGMEDAELLLSGQLREPFLEIVFGAQGSDPRKAQGVLQRDGQNWSASLALIALATEEQVATLDVTAQFSLDGAPYRQRFSEGGFTEMAWVVPYTVTYQILTDDGTTLSAECEAHQVRSHVNISPQFSGD
jgi:hypothetical protein